jgi:ribonuclease HI
VLKNEAGIVVDRLRKYIGVRTSVEAEYEGLILGLEAALARGATRVSIRADSEVMIRQLRGEYRVNAANLRPLYGQAVALLGRFEAWDAKHIPREENAEADGLANAAIDDELLKRR